MEKEKLEKILAGLAAGHCSVAEVMAELKQWPAQQLEGAHLDHHRRLRTGIPEVVYGAGKSAEQIIKIMGAMLSRGEVVLATRIDPEKAATVGAVLSELTYHSAARMLSANLPAAPAVNCRGRIVVLSAGTSDESVAEEAAITAEALANPVDRLYDAGVAGIHRLLGHRQTLEAATVLIVVAGMEGALPSVVGGLVDKPVIAVPTSVGYGVGFGGIAALLGMLNSCVPGVVVVNIDNGFGAACAAAAINRRAPSPDGC